FDRDGNLDLVVGLSSPDRAKILLGDGSGGISRVAADLPLSANSFAVADFNLDGLLDLAVGGSVCNVVMDDGHGNFSEPISLPAGNSPLQVVAADFNLDGKPDLALANFNGSGSFPNPYEGSVTILLGDGLGASRDVTTSQSAQVSRMLRSATSIAIAS